MYFNCFECVYVMAMLLNTFVNNTSEDCKIFNLSQNFDFLKYITMSYQGTHIGFQNKGIYLLQHMCKFTIYLLVEAL